MTLLALTAAADAITDLASINNPCIASIAEWAFHNRHLSLSDNGKAQTISACASQ
jgi:hypothetical protein